MKLRETPAIGVPEGRTSGTPRPNGKSVWCGLEGGGAQRTPRETMCCGQRNGLSSQEETKPLAGLEQDAQVCFIRVPVE